MVLQKTKKRPAGMDERSSNRDCPDLKTVLSQLAKALACARQTDTDPWQFAVEIEHLIADGLTTSDLRWLVSRGYTSHAYEVTRLGDSVRKFQACCNLSFSRRTCFVLTEAGARIAGDGESESALGKANQPALAICGSDAAAEEADEKPVWNGQRRVLLLGKKTVKQFKVSAAAQEAILDAFQEEGWPSAIDDPLPPMADQEPKRRLHCTIQSLNRSQVNSLIRFRGDGSGNRDHLGANRAFRRTAPPAATRRVSIGKSTKHLKPAQ